MALRWKAFAPNTILKAVEIQDITDNGVVQLDTAADLADADLVNANATYVTAEHKIYQRVASGVGADKWQVFLGGGKSLQVVRATDTTNRSTTSTSYVDATGMSVTITPQKSDSAIVIMVFAEVFATGSGGSSAYGRLSITDSSNNALSGAQDNRFGTNVATTGSLFAMAVLVAYATPATTSAVTYKLRFTVDSSNVTLQLRNATTTGQLYAIEVSA